MKSGGGAGAGHHTYSTVPDEMGAVVVGIMVVWVLVRLLGAVGNLGALRGKDGV